MITSREDNTNKRKNSVSVWIHVGYEYYAESGPGMLSIKNIAEKAGVPRTSFYYLFKDLREYKQHLLSHHEVIAEKFMIEVKTKCHNLFPDLLSRNSHMLKFHRQLFLNRNDPEVNSLYGHLGIMLKDLVFPLLRKHFSFKKSFENTDSLIVDLMDVYFSKLNINDLSTKNLEKSARYILNYLEDLLPDIE